MESTRRHVLRAGVGATLGVGATGLLGSQLWHTLTSPARTSTPSALVAGSLLSLADDTPGASIEAHGSLAVRRLVQDGARDPDVVALADPALFDGLADELTLFATNALTLAYDPESTYADALQDDWATGLQQDGIRLGRTDPEADPLGYRTVLALDLAVQNGLLDRADPVLANSTVLPEVQLMRVLERGGVDAAFVYRSMAIEHDLPTVELPPIIDFSDPTLAETYASVTLELETQTIRGAPIRYAAAPLTRRGRSWFETLVETDSRLRDHGFGVPTEYPTTRAVE
ncbi:extracellular solute-binding protein [Halorarius litoreus]|uniref:extracellular solute-binding protein n=1 Tax=Halorarius litoreus TaxID=2962676 RepID=UPI0020CEFF30|nr:extracellular solute-binding protein [Halorarius litoreus]